MERDKFASELHAVHRNLADSRMELAGVTGDTAVLRTQKDNLSMEVDQLQSTKRDHDTEISFLQLERTKFMSERAADVKDLEALRTEKVSLTQEITALLLQKDSSTM